jgi:NADH dehydrogenase
MATLKRVVILGGGFAGVRVARILAKSADRQHMTITLISKDGIHAYTPSFYAIAGAASDGALRRELDRISQFPLRRIFAGLPVALVHAEVTKIDTKHQNVLLGDGRTVGYDKLVIALGSEACYYGIPGLKENAITLKTIRDAETISRTVAKLMRGRDKPIRVTIGGGGPTGVELSAMLAEKMAAYQAGVHITLIEGQKSVLCGFTEKVQKYVTKELTKRKVNLMTGLMITEAKQNCVVLDNKEVVEHDVLVWAGGTQAPAILSTLPYILEKGRIAIDAPLTCVPSEGGTQTDVFAIGDSTIMHHGTGTAPWTAQVALKQADHVAKNILRQIQKLPLKKFKLRHQDILIPLGVSGGYCDAYHIHFTGRIVQSLAWLVEGRYLRTILPWRVAIGVITRRRRVL